MWKLPHTREINRINLAKRRTSRRPRQNSVKWTKVNRCVVNESAHRGGMRPHSETATHKSGDTGEGRVTACQNGTTRNKRMVRGESRGHVGGGRNVSFLPKLGD